VDARSVTNNGSGKVQCELTGPSGKRHLCPVQNNNDGTYTVQYVPNEVGPYLLDVTYENIPVPGSTFRTQAVPGCDPRRVKVYGPGLEGGLTNTPCQFTVETKGCGQGSLSLAIEGPSEAKMFCKENQNGVCVMEYLPIKAGPYDITIKYADQDVPGSPFRVYIEDRVDPGKVSVQLPKKPFRVNTPSDVVIDTRGAGKAELRVELTDSHGRVKAVPVKPQPGGGANEGLYVANVIPAMEGPHRLDVKWNSVAVPNAPFPVNVFPKFDPSKVRVEGAGVRHGIPASLPAAFIVDTKEAGEAQLDVSIKDSEGNLVQPRVENNSDGTYNVAYVPEDVGRYTISVLFGGLPVKDSPFNVKVDPVGDAQKCVVYGKFNFFL
jgi:filamin